MRIRQIVFAAQDLAKGREQIAQLLGLTAPFRDPGVAEFGIDNAVFAFGDQFIEVIAPVRPGTACGRHLDRHGDSPYMLILQSADFASEERRLDALNVRRVWRATYDNISATHLHPKDIGGAIVSIDEARPASSWRWGGPEWQTGAPRMAAEQARQRVRRLRLHAPDPETLARRWAQVLGLKPASPASPASSASTAATGCQLALQDGQAEFVAMPASDPAATAEARNEARITGFSLEVASVPDTLSRARELGLAVNGNCVTLMGAELALSAAN